MEALNGSQIRELVERVQGFTKFLEDDTISPVEVANVQSMRKVNIEKVIKSVHNYSICTRSDGLLQTKVKDRKTISAKTLDRLYEKLFYYYFGDPSIPTMNSVFDEWMIEKETFRSSETIMKNKYDWDKYVRGAPIAKKPIKQIQAYELLEFYRGMVGNEQMKRRCFTNVKSIINEVFDYGAIHYGLKANPSRLVRTKNLNFAPDTAKRQDYFSAEERNAIIQYLFNKPNDRYALAIILQFSLGCRIGELKALEWEDYDEDRKTIFIHKEVVKRKQGDKQRVPIIVMHTKGKKEEANRILPLSSDAIWALEHAKQFRNNQTNLIFMNTSNEPIEEGKYNYWLKKYCKEAGVQYHTSHDIRRFIISAELEAGLPDVIVQKNSGHLNFTTTLKYKRDVGFRRYNQAFLDIVSTHPYSPIETGEENHN